ETPSAVPAVFSEPRPVVVAVRLHYERVSLPMANSVSQPSRFRRILGKSSSIRPDGSPIMAPLKELNGSVRQLKELESVVVREETRIAQRIASHHGIFGIRKGYSERALFRSCGLILFVAPSCKWGHILHIEFHAVVSPHTR